MKTSTAALAALLVPAALLAACSTSVLPSAEEMQLKDFRQRIVASEGEFIEGSEIPAVPDDVRSKAEWDRSARELEALAANFDVPETSPPLSDAQFRQEFERLQREALEYREDDPQ